MDVGDRVKVNAPGHHHNGTEGQIVALGKGDMPHVEVKQAESQDERVHVKYTGTFDEAKKAKNKTDTTLIQGSAGETFAEVTFGDGSVYKYHSSQLGAI